jgi:hypothetical protein
MRLLAMTALILLSSCGTMHFAKDGAGQKEVTRDWNDCRVKMGQSGVAQQGIVFQRSFMQECMEGQGWVRTD